MTNKVYLFSFKCASKEQWTADCISERMTKLYDIQKIHQSLYLIKTTEDTATLEKYLMACFDQKDTYFLVDITEKSFTHKNISASGLSGWLNDI